jgi:hypothetical protein
MFFDGSSHHLPASAAGPVSATKCPEILIVAAAFLGPQMPSKSWWYTNVVYALYIYILYIHIQIGVIYVESWQTNLSLHMCTCIYYIYPKLYKLCHRTFGFLLCRYLRGAAPSKVGHLKPTGWLLECQYCAYNKRNITWFMGYKQNKSHL